MLIVKTMERVLHTEKPILYRIHMGTEEGLEHYWDRWNRLHGKTSVARYDIVVGEAAGLHQACLMVEAERAKGWRRK